MRKNRIAAGSRRAGLLLATAAAALSFSQVASAGITPGDTFTFAIAGFNSAGTVGYILGSGYSAVFGETTTFAAAGYNGQAYTISSYEVVGATTTTDYFKISTPTNFLTTSKVNGTTITALQFDIGDANSGVGVDTGADPLDFSSAVTSYTAAGNIVYGTANTSFTLTPGVTLGNGGLSFSAAEGVNTGTSAITSVAVHEFNFSISYATPAAAVPEPETWALLLAGLGVTGSIARRKSRASRS